MAVSFIGGGNWSTQRKQPICRKLLTNFITYCCIEYTSPWRGFELTTLIVFMCYLGGHNNSHKNISLTYKNAKLRKLVESRKVTMIGK